MATEVYLRNGSSMTPAAEVFLGSPPQHVADWVKANHTLVPIQYLQSSGTQYIDTEFKANTTTTRFKGRFIPLSKTGNQALLGSRNTANSYDSTACNVFLITSNFRIDWFKNQNIAFTVGQEYEIEITRNEYKINGSGSTQTNTQSINQNYNFLIGNLSNGSAAPFSTGFVGQWKSAMLYSNGTLVRDFIPVRFNGVGYMFDRVSHKLFGNKGTGSFALGPDL